MTTQDHDKKFNFIFAAVSQILLILSKQQGTSLTKENCQLSFPDFNELTHWGHHFPNDNFKHLFLKEKF